jgi:hypothetical protein
MEGGAGSLGESWGNLYSMLQTYGLPNKPLNIDEYATLPEQVPSGSVWWIAQLERINAIGLRGNWLSGDQLHDFMSNLVSKPNATTNYVYTEGGYFPVSLESRYWWNGLLTINRMEPIKCISTTI